MLKIKDLVFDMVTPETTGIIYDGQIVKESEGKSKCLGVGKLEIDHELDKELAEACECDLESIEVEIYKDLETSKNKDELGIEIYI